MPAFRLTPDAKASLMQIALYTQQTWGEKQRRVYIKEIDGCFHKLAASPMQGKARPEIYHTLRSHPVGRHIIYYMIKDDHIVIVNVLHDRMDPVRHISQQAV
jgi:toxin ParE1/3/4